MSIKCTKSNVVKKGQFASALLSLRGTLVNYIHTVCVVCLVRNDSLESEIKNQPLVLEVRNANLDGAGSEVIGKANVPLHMLLEGVSIHESSYDLLKSGTNNVVGTILASAGWNQPLQIPAAISKSNCLSCWDYSKRGLN